MEGYIKFFRKFLEWEWINKPEMVSLFIFLLLSANYEDKKWNGIIIKRGQLATGRFKLSKLLGISEQSLRTSLNRLKSTNEITIESTNKYSIITICNYDKYQDYKNETNQQINQQSTNNQPTTNQQLTTTKNNKNNKNIYIYHENFYKIENENLNGHELTPHYKLLIEFLYGKNETKEPLRNVLSIKKQLSFDQFVELMKYKPKDTKLGQILLKMENDPKYTNKKISLYITLKNWLTGKFIHI